MVILYSFSPSGFSSSEKMTGVFSYESSYLDWCEANYRHSEHIVEYFNTMSSLFFFVISPIMLYLLHPYARERNLAVHLVWIMMIFVGLFSPYFHMTLSFMGQMLDELSILWVLGLCYTLVPTQAIPTQAIPLLHQGQDHAPVLSVWNKRHSLCVSYTPPLTRSLSLAPCRTTFSRLVMVITVVTTLCSFVKPTANAYVLNCFAFHIYSLGLEMKICTDQKVMVMLVCCWPVVDGNHMLDQWPFRMQPLAKAQLLLPAWHLVRVGHILIVMAVAYASTLIAYLDANYEIPYSLPGLQYWPSDNCALGLPYIVLKGTTKTQKIC
ncbi:unnamed protein product [Coregonus sp. 'balchen']|nr:unnamed protein product [Coregonus sp. 'balchen']